MNVYEPVDVGSGSLSGAKSDKWYEGGGSDTDHAKVQKKTPLAPTCTDMKGAGTGDLDLEIFDRLIRAWLSKPAGGLSPLSIAAAGVDWGAHMAVSPGKMMELAVKGADMALDLAAFNARAMGCLCTPSQSSVRDRRFSEPGWQCWPYSLMAETSIKAQEWWSSATRDVRGASPHHLDMVHFFARQWLDMISPSNFIPTNPVLTRKTVETGGANLINGWSHWMADVMDYATGKPPAPKNGFIVGKTMATTPGKVVYRNNLIELIQYEPVTDTVKKEPILIVPAWIMKYYILDLSPDNSLVDYLRRQGHTVFILSWHNPTAEDRDIGMADYRQHGVMAAIDAVSEITGGEKIHATGYCIGGTLLSIAAAAMSRDGDDRLASLSLFTTQLDFEEAGELLYFIDHSQLSRLEDLMWAQGYLKAEQLSGAFNLLRSKDLLWSRLTQEYLKGERMPINDLMAWNTDATRMPYRMHSEYLRWLYLDNDLARARYMVNGRPIAISDIKAPVFSVGTVKDHIAPWRSVYKMHLYADTEITFVLTSGGHNAGIVSEPGHPRRTYQVATKQDAEIYIPPEDWQANVPVKNGSWWPEWVAWLDKKSSGERVPARKPGTAKNYKAIADAPGTYVFER